MDRNKAISDLRASVTILIANIDLYHSGTKDVYRVVACELRKLVCDGKNSLLLKLFGDIKLHRIADPYGNSFEIEKKNPDAKVFILPGRMEFKRGQTTRVVNIFDYKKPPIPLSQWVNQPLFKSNLSIKDYIKSIADKEAAHSDSQYNETLKLTKSVKFTNTDVNMSYIICIGEYILRVINKIINTTNRP